MRSPDNDATSSKHILDIDFLDPELDKTAYIDRVFPLVKNRLTGPESAVFLRDLYNYEYNGADRSSHTEIALGSVLKRESEDPYISSRLNILLNEYRIYNYSKFFGLTISAFMQLTPFETSKLRQIAIAEIDKANEELARLESNAKTSPNGSTVFDDIFQE